MLFLPTSCTTPGLCNRARLRGWHSRLWSQAWFLETGCSLLSATLRELWISEIKGWIQRTSIRCVFTIVYIVYLCGKHIEQNPSKQFCWATPGLSWRSLGRWSRWDWSLGSSGNSWQLPESRKDVKRCADSTWFKRWLKVGQIFCSFQFPFRFGTFPADIPLQVHKAFVMPHARFTQAIQRWRSQLERLPRSSFKNLHRESVSPVATFCSPNVAEYSVCKLKTSSLQIYQVKDPNPDSSSVFPVCCLAGRIEQIVRLCWNREPLQEIAREACHYNSTTVQVEWWKLLQWHAKQPQVHLLHNWIYNCQK